MDEATHQKQISIPAQIYRRCCEECGRARLELIGYLQTTSHHYYSNLAVHAAVKPYKDDDEAEVTASTVTWADEAVIRAGLPSAKGLVEGKVDNSTVEERRLLTILALRHYKQVQSFIAASAGDTFPAPKGRGCFLSNTTVIDDSSEPC